jgi:hypothetical protein
VFYCQKKLETNASTTVLGGVWCGFFWLLAFGFGKSQKPKAKKSHNKPPLVAKDQCKSHHILVEDQCKADRPTPTHDSD